MIIFTTLFAVVFTVMFTAVFTMMYMAGRKTGNTAPADTVEDKELRQIYETNPYAYVLPMLY